ncbi:MAG: trigger factor [Phycisphaera sp.]|nr:trigger factor [Phycisphaera sp.]
MADHDHDHTHDHAHDHDHHHHDHDHDHAHEERGEQTVAVADAGPARKKLTIELPADRIAKKIEENYSKLRNDAVIPGFRRGRTPRRLIEKRFGSSIKDDVKAQLISESYSQAVEDEKLEVIGQPDVKDIDKIELPEAGPLKFEVEVEVTPTVELPELEGIEVNKVKADVTDEDIDEQLKNYSERFGKLQPVTDGGIEYADYVKADLRILEGKDAADDAAEIAHMPEAYILVHGEDHDFKGHVAGILVDDLGKRMHGKKLGDIESVSMTGPSGHENEKIKDKDITLKIKVTSIERLDPMPIEELPAQAGVADIDALKTEVRNMLVDRNNRRQQADMHEQLRTKLSDAVTLELPAGLSSRQADRILRRRALDLAYRGVEQQEIEQKVAEMRTESQERAQKELKEFFILEAAAKKLEVSVSEAEVNGRVAMLAMQRGRRPEKMRQEMQRSGELEHLYLQLREQKTLDAILEKAKVAEVDAPVEGEGGDKPSAKKKAPRKTTNPKKESKE